MFEAARETGGTGGWRWWGMGGGAGGEMERGGGRGCSALCGFDDDLISSLAVMAGGNRGDFCGGIEGWVGRVRKEGGIRR